MDFLENAHKRSSCHKQEICKSNLCGCFYCLKTFLPTEIEEWIEENDNRGETAVCPKCGIDSVLSDEFPIEDKIFMEQMCLHWFN
ncbi:hypothetical protein LG45_08860 [Flavobacterium aquatile LMG 4008 = ATCC 11947]|uniref:Cytoplasmic protein n=1 Tax=Flavobacterium aquatile LMG 4008 = ATCC 11947 TaxID=1453498 RepID=A0A095SUN3_9FLAO|nr:hypothetical protein LG45_08860 [Flavobacterium aquatile LMG 4008 = ATCC 11947]